MHSFQCGFYVTHFKVGIYVRFQVIWCRKEKKETVRPCDSITNCKDHTCLGGHNGVLQKRIATNIAISILRDEALKGTNGE